MFEVDSPGHTGSLYYSHPDLVACQQASPWLTYANEPPAEPENDDLGDSLRRWLANTETTIRWSDGTRKDWDRHLRPVLARRFEIATGQRMIKDPAAYAATGRMLFGAELWEWVNPNNVAPTDDHERAPGRGALEEILQKLEQLNALPTFFFCLRQASQPRLDGTPGITRGGFSPETQSAACIPMEEAPASWYCSRKESNPLQFLGEACQDLSPSYLCM